MSVLCPNGHRSQTSDYCDQCGVPIAVPASPASAATSETAVDESDTAAAAPQEPCPGCGASRSGDDRYCEECGHDFAAPRWEAVVTADRHQFERYAANGLAFPDDYAARRFAIAGEAVRIGRSHGGAGEPAPEIDLAGPAADPGVSRLHAVLERREDGSYAVRDLGSTNGTTVNDSPVGTDGAVPVGAGDRIEVGAWTTITLRLASEVVPSEHA